LDFDNSTKGEAMNLLKVITGLQSDEEKLAERQRELEADQAAFERRRTLALHRDARMNAVAASKVEFQRLSEALEKYVVDYAPEKFARGFLNNGGRIEDNGGQIEKFAVKYNVAKNIKTDLLQIINELEKLVVAPKELALDNFLREHKSELSKLPKPERKPEPAFVPTKLEPDFYTSGKSGELVKRYQ
jgi:hypothetical protein